MAAVVLVSHDVDWAVMLTETWHAEQRAPHLVLLDAATAVARATHPLAARLGPLTADGVVVWAHDDALTRHAITAADVSDGVKTVTLDEIADVIGEARGQVLWL